MAAELEQLRVSLVAELVGREAFEQLKREVNQVKAATAGLDNTQQKLRATVTEAETAVRAQRQAFAQGGMQINQFAGQIAAGTPVMTAFIQQIGDVAYVVGQAGDSMGKVGRFLQGPWAAAILVAISVLGPLIGKLFQTKDATEELEKVEKMKRETTLILRDAQLDYNMAVADTPEKQRKAIVAIIDAAKADYDATMSIVRNTKTRIGAIDAEIKAINERTRIQTGKIGGDIGAGGARAGVALKGYIQEKSAIGDLTEAKAKLAEVEKNAAGAFKELRGAQARLVNFDQNQAEAAAKAGAKTAKGYEKAAKEAEKLRKEQEELAQEIRVFTLKDAVDFAKAMEKVSQESSKAIDQTASQVLQTTMSVMGDQFTRMKEEIDAAVYKGADAIKGLSETMGETFSAGIKGMITGAMSFKQVMTNVIDSIISKLFEMFVVQQITGMIAKGLSGLTGITLPGKAIGGPVQGGKPYIVGERGPEMFVPSRSGSIVPNKGLGGGMTINVDARGASDPAAVRAQVEQGIAQAAPYIIAAAQNKTLTTAARPRLPGTLG